MAADELTSGARLVGLDLAQIEAKRLLADPRLHVSDRHRAFLKYIIDAFFNGRTDAVKAYSIAIDVFNRPQSFDPSSDPIVRIEATRLRETLQKYYELIADEPGARLEIPRGRYIPVFVERDCAAPETRDEPKPAEESAEHDKSASPLQSSWRYALAGGIVLAVASVSIGLLYQMATPKVLDTQKPFVSLSMSTAQKDAEAGEAVLEDLAMSLARFGTVRLRPDTTEMALSTSGSEQSAYSIKIRYSEGSDAISIWWQVSDVHSGEAIWTDQELRPAEGGMRDDVMRDLVSRLSRKISGPAGVVNTAELRRRIPESAIGNICVLRGEYAIDRRDTGALRAARPCLEATVSADPKNFEAMAALARVMLWTSRTTGDDAYLTRSLDLANRAASISPTSSRTSLAQMATYYQFGQIDAAVAAGRRGAALNPENAELVGSLSLVLFLDGSWQEGVELADKAIEVAGEPVRDASFVKILDAYRREDFREAVSLARHLPAADTPTTVLKLAAIARMGDRSATDKEIASARLQHPDLDRTISAMFSGRRYDRDLEAALRRGITEAGLIAPLIAKNGSL